PISPARVIQALDPRFSPHSPQTDSRLAMNTFSSSFGALCLAMPNSPRVRQPCSGIVIATIPGFKERHVIARLHFHRPGIIFILGLAEDKSEGGAEAFHREGSYFDPVEPDVA